MSNTFNRTIVELKHAYIPCLIVFHFRHSFNRTIVELKQLFGVDG